MPPYVSSVSEMPEEKVGVAVVRIEGDFDQPSQTEQLSIWIHRVRSKKIQRRRNLKRDLRVEAVLSSALTKAEMELRNKQISRIKRWQKFKSRLLEGSSVHHLFRQSDYSAICENNYDPWQDPALSSELGSLETFMSQLKEIKDPLQR